VFNTAVSGRVVMIDTRTLPETACWVIRTSDLLEFRSKLEDVSDQLQPEASVPLRAGGKPSTRTALQDQAVIEILNRLGHDPKALPPKKPGHKWVKFYVRREALATRKDLFTTGTLDRTWERLLGNGEISERK
jgi:hypothetical protein